MILLKCPFCGGEPVEYPDNGLESQIHCGECEVDMYVVKDGNNNYIDICRERWNRRHNPEWDE